MCSIKTIQIKADKIAEKNVQNAENPHQNASASN